MPRHGENIRKRKDGRWEGRYTLYTGDGTSVVRSVYARTFADVKEKLWQAKREQASAKERNGADAGISGIAFGTAAGEWLMHMERSKKYSTYRKYRNIYEKHLAGRMGSRALSELNQEVIREALQEDGRQAERSESLQKSIVCVLNQILAYAQMQYHTGFIRYSPGRHTRENRPVPVLNYTEQSKLLCYLYSGMDICKLGIVVCISTGLRLGEICALKWSDIDLEGEVIHVNRTVQRISVDGRPTKTVLMEGTPKSVFSKREIPISGEIARLLTLYQEISGYVIGQAGPMEPRTYQKRFQSYLREAGIERKNFHILRHTFATNCVASGVDIKSLSEILGHSDVKITLNRYVHPDIETKRSHMNTLSAVYGQYMGQKHRQTAR